MDNANNYPSCIKIPSTNSKQNMTSGLPQRFDIKQALVLNNELILLANRIFGEGKWNHVVTNQTIDFIEAFMGKYVCGCVTFIKIQLQNGTFHEDIGYCHAEGTMKGLSIHCARIGSHTEAFKKVLLCFGKEIGAEVQKVFNKLSSSHTLNNQKEDLQCSLFGAQNEILEPCAQSTPLISHRNDEKKDTSLKSKSPNDQKQQPNAQQIVTRSKSPVLQKIQPASLKTLNDVRNQIQFNEINHHKEQDNAPKEQNSKKAFSEEELLRMERKRKQMEKQAEYKRLMKEKEQQKSNENKKPNPKY